MHKEDNRQEYLKQALKIKSRKRKAFCDVWMAHGKCRAKLLNIYDRIQQNRYQNEVEKEQDEKKYEDEVQAMGYRIKNEIFRRKNHDRRRSPDYTYTYATQIMNHRKQDQLVQTLAKYVKHKNEHYIQDLN